MDQGVSHQHERPQACSQPVTWPTTTIDKRSRRPAPVAWPPWTPNVTSPNMNPSRTASRISLAGNSLRESVGSLRRTIDLIARRSRPAKKDLL